jgi:hypothetical protein
MDKPWRTTGLGLYYAAYHAREKGPVLPLAEEPKRQAEQLLCWGLRPPQCNFHFDLCFPSAAPTLQSGAAFPTHAARLSVTVRMHRPLERARVGTAGLRQIVLQGNRFGSGSKGKLACQTHVLRPPLPSRRASRTVFHPAEHAQDFLCQVAKSKSSDLRRCFTWIKKVENAYTPLADCRAHLLSVTHLNMNRGFWPVRIAHRSLALRSPVWALTAGCLDPIAAGSAVLCWLNGKPLDMALHFTCLSRLLETLTETRLRASPARVMTCSSVTMCTRHTKISHWLRLVDDSSKIRQQETYATLDVLAIFANRAACSRRDGGGPGR